MLTAQEFVLGLASGMRMCIVTSTSFDHRTISVESYLPGDKRKSMYGTSTHSFELAARRLLKHHRPDVYEEIRPNLMPLSHSERGHR